MNKKEYKRELESIQRWLDKKVDPFCYGDSAGISPENYIIFPLRALVETLIARELYQLDREENGGGNDQ